VRRRVGFGRGVISADLLGVRDFHAFCSAVPCKLALNAAIGAVSQTVTRLPFGPQTAV